MLLLFTLPEWFTEFLHLFCHSFSLCVYQKPRTNCQYCLTLSIVCIWVHSAIDPDRMIRPRLDPAVNFGHSHQASPEPQLEAKGKGTISLLEFFHRQAKMTEWDQQRSQQELAPVQHTGTCSRRRRGSRRPCLISSPAASLASLLATPVSSLPVLLIACLSCPLIFQCDCYKGGAVWHPSFSLLGGQLWHNPKFPPGKREKGDLAKKGSSTRHGGQLHTETLKI